MQRVLIVEDQFLIAAQLQAMVESLGHEVVGIATDFESACAQAIALDPDLAFVDINLGSEKSGIDVARYFQDCCKTRVVFTTANRRRLAGEYCGAIGAIDKPFTMSGILSALRFIDIKLTDETVALAKPESLMLSPEYDGRWHALA